MNAMKFCRWFAFRPTQGMRFWILLLMPMFLLPLDGTAPPGWETAAIAGSIVTKPSRSARPLFQKRCSDCHEIDGTGSNTREILPQMPNFTNRRWQQQRSDAQLLITVLEGKGTQMPPFGGKISKEQARDLVAYIRSFVSTRDLDTATVPIQVKKDSDADSDFEKRFRQLEEEFDQLRKQLDELSRSSQNQRSQKK
jgi:mono/diheme cytochrome c family protein